MKQSHWLRSVCLCFGTAIVLFFALPVFAQGNVVSCNSDDMGYHTCDIGQNGGVTVYRQHSDVQCIQGQTFGVRGNQMWVDRGCRAEFQVQPYRAWNQNGSSSVVNCNSDDMNLHTCDIGPNGGVVVYRQHSDAQCIQGQTFGVRGNQMWVNRGCRAEFTVLPQNNWSQGGSGAGVVTCSSDDMHRHSCAISPNSRARLVRQHSDAACVEGQTWGQNGNQIWVDRGCRADFEVRARRGDGDHDGGRDRDRDRDHDRGNYGGTRTVTCSSDDMHRHTCDVGPNQGIRLVKQRSDTRCDLNRSYGFNGNQIWVDKGCRADFEVAQR